MHLFGLLKARQFDHFGLASNPDRSKLSVSKIGKQAQIIYVFISHYFVSLFKRHLQEYALVDLVSFH